MWRLVRRWSEARDRGATMITFALLATVIFAFVGLGVDGAVFYAKKQEAQNGADAAALALAQKYAVDSGCVQDFPTADGYVQANATWGVAGHVASDIDCSVANEVTVQADATFDPFFSQVINIRDVTARARATVEWGPPYRGKPLLPITFAICDFDEAVEGGQTTIWLPKHAPEDRPDTCKTYEPSENIMPAGFGYLGDGCRTMIDINDPWVNAQDGNTPKNCSQSEMAKWVGEVILLPVFDACRTGKANVENCPRDTSLSPRVQQYHIKQFAAWRLDGYYFDNTYRAGVQRCGPPQTCVTGSFVEWVELGQDFEIGPAPDTDTLIIRFAG